MQCWLLERICCTVGSEGQVDYTTPRGQEKVERHSVSPETFLLLLLQARSVSPETFLLPLLLLQARSMFKRIA
jgi:hypothetical protein